MAKPVIFYHLFSPPARTVYMLAKYIGLDFEEKEVKLFEGETHSESYRKTNVTGTVPALLDGEVSVFDSHAIMLYLVEKYAKNDDLYPKDNFLLRTRINEVLFYEASYLYPRLYQITVPIYMFGETEISDEKKAGIERAYACFEKFLTDFTYIAGDQLTLADFSVWSILESTVKLIPVASENYPKIFAYLERMRQELPFKDLVLNTVNDHIKLVEGCIARNKAAKAEAQK